MIIKIMRLNYMKNTKYPALHMVPTQKMSATISNTEEAVKTKHSGNSYLKWTKNQYILWCFKTSLQNLNLLYEYVFAHKYFNDLQE